MPFRNPVVAGTQLVRSAIESSNYDPGSAGWAIFQDGAAEFNSATFRGTIVIETAGQALLIYSGPAAEGNLIGSWAATAGEDSFGNPYPAGLSIESGTTQVLTEILLGEVIQRWITVNPDIQTPAFLQAATSGLGPAQIDQFLIQSAQNATNTDVAGLVLHSNNNNGSQIAAFYAYYEGAEGQSNYLTVNSAGAVISAGSITAVEPGTGTPATQAAAETWHSATSLLSAIWTTAGTSNPLRYRLEPQGSGGGCVRLDGEILTTGTGPWPPNVDILKLPAGYIPVNGHPFVTRSSIALAAGQDTINVIAASGGIQNGQTFVAAGQSLYFDGVVFPLD
jgi:hypothetical protein